MKEIKVFLSLIVLTLISVNSYAATDTRWFGNGENWSNTDFWVGGLEPTSEHSCQIDGTVVVSLADEVVGKGFYVGRYSGDDSTVQIISGDLTVSDSVQTAFIGYSGKGTLEILDGTFEATALTILGNSSSGEGFLNIDGGSVILDGLRLGERGFGTVTQTDGTVDADGVDYGTYDGSGGIYQISGGTLLSSWFKLGPNRFRTVDATFNILGHNADITFTSDFSFYSPNSVFTAAAGSKIKMQGQYADFINEMNAANQENVLGLKNLTMEFSDNSTTTYNTYEVASVDLGASVSGYCGGNFALNTLSVGGDTPSKVRLVDSFDNGNRGGGSECLYVRKLIVTDGSTLSLNGLNLYYQQAEIEGTIISGTPQEIDMLDMNDDGVVAEYELSKIAEYWLDDDCGCPDICGGADLDTNGMVDLFDFAILGDNWLAD